MRYSKWEENVLGKEAITFYNNTAILMHTVYKINIWPIANSLFINSFIIDSESVKLASDGQLTSAI